MLNEDCDLCYILPQGIFLTGDDGRMCSTLDRLLGYCGYMDPSTKLSLVAVAIAAFIAMALTARN